MTNNIAIVIPAKNEADNLDTLLPKIKLLHPDIQINIINDGSIDNTMRIISEQISSLHYKDIDSSGYLRK